MVVLMCATSVGYLKLLDWRDRHDLDTSGTALSASAVIIACAIFSVVATLAVVLTVG